MLPNKNYEYLGMVLIKIETLRPFSMTLVITQKKMSTWPTTSTITTLKANAEFLCIRQIYLNVSFNTAVTSEAKAENYMKKPNYGRLIASLRIYIQFPSSMRQLIFEKK